MNKQSWFLIMALVLGIVLVFSGLPKLFDDANLYKPFEEFGWPRWTYFATGAAEVLAGLMLFLRRTRILGASIAVAIMVGAFVTNLANGDPAPALMTLLLGSFGCITAWHWSDRPTSVGGFTSSLASGLRG